MSITTNQLTDKQQAEMILRGIEAKIDETLRNADEAKVMGNMRAWANYLSVAADWANKLVETRKHFNILGVGA